MPGVIMDEASNNGSRANLDTDTKPNGINGNELRSEKGQDNAVEQRQQMTPGEGEGCNTAAVNGVNMPDPTRQMPAGEDTMPRTSMHRMNELPPEIAHNTGANLPLGMLLTRLAQQTHHRLSKTILELAQMPIPGGAVNGVRPHLSATDDASIENVNKKIKLLQFAQASHSEWTKALVITAWSRRSECVSKIVDLSGHLSIQKELYQWSVHHLSECKRSLNNARLPNPDLKTALAVLTTGKASWMPDLGYLPPPPLSNKEVLKTLQNLNTLLSIRLNLYDYDKVPWQFKDFTIQSGRATFKVGGEFEVDLTIGNEDPERQFWFIDFRFKFFPETATLSPHLRALIEKKVNYVLATENLLGCYKLLHEIVLTHKISEFRKQAYDLARGRWIEGLRIEQLNRSLSVQYWVDRYPKGPKSFFILGVHSGRRPDGYIDPRQNSRLSVRWFRDGKEMKDTICYDTVNISTEQLLKTIIARHVNHILTSTYDKLRVKPIFATHEAAISLIASDDEPLDSRLTVQLTAKEYLIVNIDQVSGNFVFSPASRIIFETQHRLNSRTVDPASDAHQYIENLRCLAIIDEVNMYGMTVGWVRSRGPALRQEDLKPVLPRDTLQIAWFQRAGWQKEWFVVFSVGMSGERWCLIEIINVPVTINFPTGLRVAAHIPIPIKNVSPIASYSFLSSLPIFAAGLVSHYTNLRALHTRHVLRQLRRTTTPTPIKLPSVYLRLSDVLNIVSTRTKKPWAHDFVKLTFQGLERVPAKSKRSISFSADDITQEPPREKAIMISEARFVTPLSQTLRKLRDKVDRDMAFQPDSGCFAFRLRSEVGDSVIPLLIERLRSVSRLIECVDVLRRHEDFLICDNISLSCIVFTYPPTLQSLPLSSSAPDKKKARLQTYTATLDFASLNAHMLLRLSPQNPHLRVLDTLTTILNEPSTSLNAVATLIPITLPLLRAFDAIELLWTPLYMKGEPIILVRAIDSYILRYNFTPRASGPGTVNKLNISLKLQNRKAHTYWWIRRSVGGLANANVDGDDFDKALKEGVWSVSGEVWNPMGNGCVALGVGVEDAVMRVDAVVRSVLETRSMNNEERRVDGGGGGRISPGKGHLEESQKGSQKGREIVEID